MFLLVLCDDVIWNGNSGSEINFGPFQPFLVLFLVLLVFIGPIGPIWPIWTTGEHPAGLKTPSPVRPQKNLDQLYISFKMNHHQDHLHHLDPKRRDRSWAECTLFRVRIHIYDSSPARPHINNQNMSKYFGAEIWSKHFTHTVEFGL